MYYKKQDSNRWHSPGIVIGKIRNQIFGKHGTFFRVNPCNIDFVEKKYMYDKRGMMSLGDDDKLCDVEDESDFEIRVINRSSCIGR